MKIVLCYSGGLDSTVLLYHLLARNHKIKCVSFNYGQTHVKELKYASKICTLLGIENTYIDVQNIANILHPDLLLSETAIVPNRNMLLISLATSLAIASEYNAVAYGCNATDFAGFPDCRPNFIKLIRKALLKCHTKSIRLLTPFIKISKEDIINLGKNYNVPFKLTWSCYKGQARPCKKCAACKLRERIP